MRIQFEAFVLDLETRQLTREGVEMHLTPKAFELLAVLVEDRPKVVSKASLLERLWPRTFVAEANVSNLVAEVRGVLDDRLRKPRWVRTVHGLGYAFCGEATTLGRPESAGADRPMCWLEWGQRRFLLLIGEHVVGRDPDVQVRLDAPTVSRRHARVVVTTEGASLEDFGSKNGTRRGNNPVTSPVLLADGDSIHIGSVLLTFHLYRHTSTTLTQASSHLSPG